MLTTHQRAQRAHTCKARKMKGIKGWTEELQRANALKPSEIVWWYSGYCGCFDCDVCHDAMLTDPPLLLADLRALHWILEKFWRWGRKPSRSLLSFKVLLDTVSKVFYSMFSSSEEEVH